MKIQNKLVVVGAVLIATTNVFVAVHINDAVNWFFDNVIIANSGIVSGVSGAYIVGLYFYKEYKANRVHVPKKSKVTTKSGMKYEGA